MENQRIAQEVKELRKRKGLSQEELAKNSGLSLRTIQRVENSETKPTGETLKRISNVFEITPNELFDKEDNNKTSKNTIKTKYEYLHIFDDKLVISKNPEIFDSIQDYGKYINNAFKSLIVIVISITVFTAVTIIFYNFEKTSLALYSAAFALLFFVNALQMILFTSGSPLIETEQIQSIKIRRKLFNIVLVISHTESGRQKDRALIIEKNQVEYVKRILTTENLIDEKDIKINDTRVGIETFITALFIIVALYLMFIKKTYELMAYYNGAIVLFASSILMLKIIIRLISPLSRKTTNR